MEKVCDPCLLNPILSNLLKRQKIKWRRINCVKKIFLFVHSWVFVCYYIFGLKLNGTKNSVSKALIFEKVGWQCGQRNCKCKWFLASPSFPKKCRSNVSWHNFELATSIIQKNLFKVNHSIHYSPFPLTSFSSIFRFSSQKIIGENTRQKLNQFQENFHVSIF